MALTGHGDFHFKAVAVKAAAFVRLGQVRQQMGRLELKCFA
jgi:hypothetical protein